MHLQWKDFVCFPRLFMKIYKCLEPNTTYIFSLTAYNEAQGEDSERILLSSTTESIKNGITNFLCLEYFLFRLFNKDFTSN